mmetsp:Transcript_8770/g.13492  ORF Transcript_8770/g.13492 Transcript_8770/m.13492 type:complete len:91 (-) Transcript_8770:688-960(-)
MCYPRNPAILVLSAAQHCPAVASIGNEYPFPPNKGHQSTGPNPSHSPKASIEGLVNQRYEAALDPLKSSRESTLNLRVTQRLSRMSSTMC